MSRKELLIAGLLLAVAVVGGASIPRLLASPATSLGIALGPGPGRSIVQAPTITKQPPVVRRQASSPVSGASAVSLTPVASATAQPTPASGAALPKHAASPPPEPPVPTAPSPTPSPAQPPAATKRIPSAPATPPGQAKTPPGQAKKSPGDETMPPGQAKTPPGQAKIPPGQAKTPPGHDPRAMHGRHNEPTVTPERQDLPGSGHGAPSQPTPPHALGPHHRRVGHLAPSSARAASPAPGGRPKARPEAREPRGKGGNGPATPPAPVTPPGHAQNGNGKGPRD